MSEFRHQRYDFDYHPPRALPVVEVVPDNTYEGLEVICEGLFLGPQDVLPWIVSRKFAWVEDFWWEADSPSGKIDTDVDGRVSSRDYLANATRTFNQLCYGLAAADTQHPDATRRLKRQILNPSNHSISIQQLLIRLDVARELLGRVRAHEVVIGLGSTSVRLASRALGLPDLAATELASAPQIERTEQLDLWQP